MKKNDISFNTEDGLTKFNYRVAIISINNDKILLQKAKKDDYYSLIGGRVHLNEDSSNAIIREVKEETGILLKKDEIKLIRVVENFFKYNKVNFHELLFIYKVNNNELYLKDNFNTLDKVDVINKWIDIKSIDDMDIRPSFIKKNLNNEELINLIINAK